MSRAARQLFDRVPVAIPRREVHGGEVAVGAERRIDETDALEELRPIDGGHEAHAGDYIADRHVHRALPPMLLTDDVVGGRSLSYEAFVQPEKRWRHCRILIAQPLDQLHREGRRQGCPLEASQDRRRRLGLAAADSQKPVG